jgi:hypothetical protein
MTCYTGNVTTDGKRLHYRDYLFRIERLHLLFTSIRAVAFLLPCSPPTRAEFLLLLPPIELQSSSQPCTGCMAVTPIYRPNGMHTLMCAQRSITHKLTNYKGCIITNVITSRLITHSLYNNIAEVKYKKLSW